MEIINQPLDSKLNRLIKFSVIIGILTVSFSVAYYFIYFLPQQENKKEEANILKEIEIKRKEKDLQVSLGVCLEKAEADHWSLIRANAKGPKGSMPVELANTLDRRYKDGKDDCYKRYPPKGTQ